MIKDAITNWRYRLPCLAYRAANRIGFAKASPQPVSFVIENADWAIRRVGEYIKSEIEGIEPGFTDVTTQPQRLVNRVVHFGSQYMWLLWGKHMSPKNQYAVSFFHGKPEDGPVVAAHIDKMLASVPMLSKIVVSTSIVEKRLLRWGVPGEKIVRIPIGVDTSLFVPPSEKQRFGARKKLGFADNAVVIGSFQKDGVGWDDGLEPKLIKGPDVFLETIDLMRRELPIAVLLTGPARGYVKKGLEKMGVPYVHIYVDEYKDLVSCYHALDMYLMTSREEGGPMGLMESMASHVPVVSTPVGMAPDLITDGINGGLVTSIDADLLAASAFSLLSDTGKMKEIKQDALKAVQSCAWPVVAQQHLRQVYEPLLANRNSN